MLGILETIRNIEFKLLSLTLINELRITDVTNITNEIKFLSVCIFIIMSKGKESQDFFKLVKQKLILQYQ